MNPHGRPFVIGIGGGSGSGKSTVARTLCDWYEPEAVLLPQDCYYRDHPELTPAQRQTMNYDEPGAIDHALLLEHLRQLARGEAIERPRYDFASHCRQEGVDRIESRAVILVEGLFPWWDEAVRAALDLRIFVDADADLRFIRRMRRDVLERGRTVESVIGQYLQTVRPMHHEWVEPARQHAHVVVENTGSLAELTQRLEQVMAPHRRPHRRRVQPAG